MPTMMMILSRDSSETTQLDDNLVLEKNIILAMIKHPSSSHSALFPCPN